MFKYQLSLLAIATILLSSTWVSAREISEDRSLSVGNVHIQTSDSSGVKIRTPQLQIRTIKPIGGRVLINRNDRHYRMPAIGRGRAIYPAVTIQHRSIGRVDPSEYIDLIRNSPLHTSTTDSSTSSEQYVQCHGESSSVSQSSQTINGRTVSSELHTTCH